MWNSPRYRNTGRLSAPLKGRGRASATNQTSTWKLEEQRMRRERRGGEIRFDQEDAHHASPKRYAEQGGNEYRVTGPRYESNSKMAHSFRRLNRTWDVGE